MPGSDGAITEDDEALSVAEKVGFPILVKAAAAAAAAA